MPRIEFEYGQAGERVDRLHLGKLRNLDGYRVLASLGKVDPVVLI